MPKALAQVFIHQDIDSPCRTWSIQNRLLVAFRGHVAARGYRQWQKVGRQVKEGERACHILAPWTVQAKEDDPDRGIEVSVPILIVFLSVPIQMSEHSSIVLRRASICTEERVPRRAKRGRLG